MGKKPCIVCAKEIGFLETAGQKDGQPVCKDCFKEYKENQKEIEQAGKEETSQRDKELYARTDEYKPHWAKNGIIQYKNERIAILKRQVGAQVQFIIALDDLTKEGYELKAIDEGRSVDGGIGAGGTTSYYYFQKLG